MHFMIIRKADAETEAGVMPPAELLEEMTAYNERLAAAGVLRGGEGLHPSAKGARIKFSAGKPTVVDGPFAESKELIAGFTLIEVGSYEEALEWVKQWPPLDGHGNVELELRQVFAAEDFGEAFTPELREREYAMRLTTESRSKG
jgi:hypothetical protein